MRIPQRFTSVALAALLFPLSASAEEPPAPPPSPPSAEEGPSKPPPTPKQEKIRKYLELSRWKETFLAEMKSSFDAQSKIGQLPANYSAKFVEVADLEGLLDRMVEIWEGLLDEETLDGAIAFWSSEAGRRMAEAQVKVPAAVREKVLPWAIEQSRRVMEVILAEPKKEGEKEWGPLESYRRVRISSQETSAIATLRNLASCQAQIQVSGKIDCDRDGIGEYGTFLELTGSVAVRNGRIEAAGEKGIEHGSDFSERGTPVKPALLISELASVDDRGVVGRKGYFYRIYLPDSAPAAGFVHEKGPAAEVGLDGGTGRIGTDLAETTWCAYAWPAKRGETGNRAFFVNQAGDVLESRNEKTLWEGEKAPAPDAAFLGAGITSEAAIGTLGRDGEQWEPTW